MPILQQWCSRFYHKIWYYKKVRGNYSTTLLPQIACSSFSNFVYSGHSRAVSRKIVTRSFAVSLHSTPVHSSYRINGRSCTSGLDGMIRLSTKFFRVDTLNKVDFIIRSIKPVGDSRSGLTSTLSYNK